MLLHCKALVRTLLCASFDQLILTPGVHDFVRFFFLLVFSCFFFLFPSFLLYSTFGVLLAVRVVCSTYLTPCVYDFFQICLFSCFLFLFRLFLLFSTFGVQFCRKAPKGDTVAHIDGSQYHGYPFLTMVYTCDF